MTEERSGREHVSWWASRHGGYIHSSDGLKKGRRLTFVDLLLLVVMTGFLVPWFLGMERSRELAGYRVQLSSKKSEAGVLLTLKIRRPAGGALSRETEAAPSGSGELVGWRIRNVRGELLHEEWDIPPQEGSSREFYYTCAEEITLNCQVHAGGQSLEIQPE